MEPNDAEKYEEYLQQLSAYKNLMNIMGMCLVLVIQLFCNSREFIYPFQMNYGLEIMQGEIWKILLNSKIPTKESIRKPFQLKFTRKSALFIDIV